MKTKKKIESNQQQQQKKKQSKVQPLSAAATVTRSKRSKDKDSNKKGMKKSEKMHKDSEKVNPGRAYMEPAYDDDHYYDGADLHNYPSTSRDLRSGRLDLSQFSGFHGTDDADDTADVSGVTMGNDINEHLDYPRHYHQLAQNHNPNAKDKKKVKGLKTKTPLLMPNPIVPQYLSSSNAAATAYEITGPNQIKIPMVNYLADTAAPAQAPTTDGHDMSMMTYLNDGPSIINNNRFSPSHSLRIDDKFSPTAVSFTSTPLTSSSGQSTDNSSPNISLRSTYINLDDEHFPGLKSRKNSLEYPSNTYDFRPRTENLEFNNVSKNINHIITTTNNGNRPVHNRHNRQSDVAIIDLRANNITTTNHLTNNNNSRKLGEVTRKTVTTTTTTAPDKNKKKKSSSIDILQCIIGTLFGNSPFVQNFLQSRQDDVAWSPVVLIEIFLRSVCAVSVTSNVVSGILILIVMLIVSPFSTLLGGEALLAGIFTSVFLLQIPTDLLRGGITFNSFLIGTFLGDLSSADTDTWTEYCVIYIIAFLAGSAVMFAWYALDGLFNRLRLPGLNAAFNLFAVIYLKGIVQSYKSPALTNDHSQIANHHLKNMTGLALGAVGVTTAMPSGSNNNNYHIDTLPFDMSDHHHHHHFGDVNQTLEWAKFFDGILLAPSQLYGTKQIWSSCFVYFAWLIFSPIYLIQALLGAMIGNLIGVLLTSGTASEYASIYDGRFAYNSILTSVSIGGMFFVFNLKSWIMSIVGSTLTALVFAALTKTALPVLGIPFMTVTWLLLSASNNKISQRKTDSWMRLLRIEDLSTPEAHLKEFIGQLNKNKPNQDYKKRSKKQTHPLPLELHL